MSTVVSLLRDRVFADARQTAALVRRAGAFVPLPWAQVAEDVGRTAIALQRLGVERGDRVVLLSPNRYEWIACDLGIQVAGGVHVPVHASLSAAQIEYQILDSGAKVVILSGPEQAEKLAPLSREWGADLRVWTFDDCPERWERHELRRWRDAISAVDVLEVDPMLNRAADSIGPQELATILYTSGTTGEPKGVMLSQQNLACNAVSSLCAFGQQARDLRLSWLPWSHIFARTCDLYTWLACGGELAIAESPESALENCRQVHPTLLNGVPYFFEKVQRGLMERGLSHTSGALAAAFGGRLRSAISGGAPLSEHVATFYHERGIHLLQGYGMTESSPVITTETGDAHRLGTVGRAIPDVEIRIAADGEIVTRGPHVMLGYWKRPEATHETIRDGWLHTGDVGEIDAEGFLKITGRKKELIVTAGGKNIAPAYLESLLKSDPLIAQAVVIGDRRSFLSALIVPDFAALEQALAQQAIVPQTLNKLDDPAVRKLYADRIAAALEDVSRYEQIGNFTLLPRALSTAAGELTLTLKLRRGEIARLYAAEIEAMYAKGSVQGCT